MNRTHDVSGDESLGQSEWMKMCLAHARWNDEVSGDESLGQSECNEMVAPADAVCMHMKMCMNCFAVNERSEYDSTGQNLTIQ